MAGDWIPVRNTLDRTREVTIIRAKTGMTCDAVVGALVRFWGWASEETEDGFIVGADRNTLIQLTNADECFWKALEDVGWLIIDANGVTIPNFDNWLSESVKKRLHEQIRSRKNRSAYEKRTNVRGERTENVRARADRREEKRREEKREEDRDVVSAAVPPLSADADPSLPILTSENGHLGPTADELMAAWNAAPCVKCSRVAGKRRIVLTARNRDPYFREHWRAAISRVADCQFLRGENDRGWVADVDWFLRPDTVLKIMEGKYDDREPAAKSGFLADLFGENVK
jgi:hypothetical protein